MAVGDFFHYLHAQPFPEFNHPFLVTGGAEMAALAGKGEQIFMAAVRTPYAGKPVMQVAAVKIPVDHFPHIRAEESVTPAELLAINLFKRLKVIFNTLVIVRSLRVSRMVLGFYRGKSCFSHSH
jgi:hypothetical protein